MQPPPYSTARPNLDPAEIDRFQRMASEWWDERGKFRPLHQLGPARLSFIRQTLATHFGRHAKNLKPLSGLRVLDIGCGGGLVAEPIARMGAAVTGIDPGADNIAAARAHARQEGIDIDYRATMAEELVAQGEMFDAVVCLEVIEHVPDVPAFLKTCASLVRPGGVLILSTINRNLKSYALAIIAAEYILGWLPRGTHQWERFVTPEELTGFLTAAGLTAPRFEGLIYDPWRDTWSLSNDIDVNYLAAATRLDIAVAADMRGRKP